MIIAPAPGLTMDQPPVTPSPVWVYGFNVRFRLGLIETIGLFGPLKDISGDQIQLPSTSEPYRSIFITPSTTTGQVLVASANSISLLDYDPSSTTLTGTCWREATVTPTGLPTIPDVVPQPAAGRVEVLPVWWFSDQDDLVVGGRSNVSNDPVFVWDRDRTSEFTALANSPCRQER